MTVRICCDAEEKKLQQNALAYDKWSVSYITNFKTCLTSKLNKSIRSKVVT